MNIESLRMFIKIVDNGSITKTAEQTYISQSALSQQIKTMEQLFNTQLIERSNRGVTLTCNGKVVYEYARHLTSTYDSMIREIQENEESNRVLHILSTPIIASYALPCTLYYVKKNFPTYSLEISSVASARIEQQINCDQGDIGFISGPPSDPSLTGQKVFSDDVFLVAGSEMNIADTIHKEDLYHHPLLPLTSDQRTEQHLEKRLFEEGIDPDRLMIMFKQDSIESIKLSTMNGYGMAFLPYMCIKKELYHKQLKIIGVEEMALHNDYYIIKKKASEYRDRTLLKLTSYIEKILADTIC